MACKKEAVDNTDGGFPIELTVEKNGRNILLKWTETKISNFESYLVVRSANPIPDNPTPPSNVIITLDDYKTASFEDGAAPFVEFVYYKVYVKVGDRFMFSPTVKFKNDFNLLDMLVTKVTFDTENNLAYIFDANQNSLFKYSYELDKLLDTLSVSSGSEVRMAVGNHGNGNELYLAKNNNFIIEIYDADNFTFKTTLATNGFVYSMVSGNNDYIYLATDHWENNFAVYQRSTKQLKDGNSSFPSSGENQLQLLSNDGLTVVGADFSHAIKYRVNDEGIILNVQSAPISNNFFGTIQNVPVSEDGQFFIPEISGTIFDQNLQNQGSLSANGLTIFTDMAFGPNTEKVWGLRTNPNELLEFDFPAIAENKRTPLNYQPIRMIRDGNQLIIVGFATDGVTFTKTIVDKFDID